ncbi:MAG: hypothetical protein GX987_05005, partial [Tissierellia bacterium]|nr:hypothetical protein [Tissierellia bacterium]
MKKRITLLILAMMLILILVGCTGNNLKKAEKFMEKGELDKAEEIYTELILEDGKNFEAYDGLINIYRGSGDIEKTAKILEKAMKEGYVAQDKTIYLELLDYYMESGEVEKVDSLVKGQLKEVELPKEFYEKYIVSKDTKEGMDVLDIGYGDLNNDGIDEIAVVYGKLHENHGPDMYQDLRFVIYDKAGEILYQMEEEYGPYTKPDFELVDLSKDGVLDLYYSITMMAASNSMEQGFIISYKDGDFVNIYNGDNITFDIGTEIVNGNALKVFSNIARQSYTIELNREQRETYNLYDPNPVWWRGTSEEIIKKDNGEPIIRCSFEVTGMPSNADVIACVNVDLEYIDGVWKPKEINPEPVNGKTILSSKKGEQYDDEEYGKNLLLGDW